MMSKGKRGNQERSLFEIVWHMSTKAFGTEGVSFHCLCFIRQVDDEDEDGANCFLCSTLTSIHVHDDASSKRVGFLFSSECSIFADSSADDYPGLRSVFLNSIDFDFNYMTVKMFRDSDFQHRTNCGVASNKPFRFGGVIMSRMRIFST